MISSKIYFAECVVAEAISCCVDNNPSFKAGVNYRLSLKWALALNNKQTFNHDSRN